MRNSFGEPDRFFKAAGCLMVFVWVLGLAFFCGVCYVAWHFISKFW